jgi:hypothetical protein
MCFSPSGTLVEAKLCGFSSNYDRVFSPVAFSTSLQQNLSQVLYIIDCILSYTIHKVISGCCVAQLVERWPAGPSSISVWFFRLSKEAMKKIERGLGE